MKINVKFTDRATEERELAFWLTIFSYIEPFVLWILIDNIHSFRIFGAISVIILALLLVTLFLFITKKFVCPLLWGYLIFGIFGFSWITFIIAGMIVFGRYWLIRYAGK
jgi:hypothetical protein